MKKLTLIALLFTSLTASFSFAADDYEDLSDLVPADEITSNQEDAVSDDVSDHDRGYYPPGRGYYPPGRGYYPPGRGYYPPGRREGFKCFAVNGRGVRFEGFAYYPRQAEQEALQNCYQYPSRYCRPMGCRRF